ncbi:MAG: primosomal protein N', partial [Muribaculaceae bacterium]|nr:primosomal protein N' [Muribaculaceae bacterium]
MSQYYAQVILPLPFDRTFTYRVPSTFDKEVSVGSRVLVPFGPSKYYTAIVESISPVAPQEAFNIKDITYLIDSRPIVRHPQLRFWRWIADYYLSPIGDVFKAALPAGLKVESETVVELNPDFDPEDAIELDDAEKAVMELLGKRKRLSTKEISSLAGLHSPEATVDRLINRGIAVIAEKIVERFRRKKIKYVS